MEEKSEVTIMDSEESPLITLIRSIAQTVTPIVTETMTSMEGPVSMGKCVSCGMSLKGKYSELNVPHCKGSMTFDRYFLCEVCTNAILSHRTD